MAYDPEFQKAQEKVFERLGFPPNRPTPRFPRGDIDSRRAGLRAFSKAFFALDPDEFTDIESKEYEILGYEQSQILVTAYRKKNVNASGPEPAVLYMHGGGMFTGEGELYAPMIKADVRGTGVPHFSVDYRLAPEFPHPVPVEDCYAALVWLSTHAQELGIDPARIGVAGLSAGGGLAGGVALLARDRGLSPPLAKQMLFCPMLDDRNLETDSASLPLMTWSWDDNWTGWNALLGKSLENGSVSEYAAPARAKDLRGLPTAYIDVGSMDIFAKEDQEYAERLRSAGVEVEWHLYDGVPHGWELRGIGTKLLEQAISNRNAAVSPTLRETVLYPSAVYEAPYPLQRLMADLKQETCHITSNYVWTAHIGHICEAIVPTALLLPHLAFRVG